jgi:hypothetical protein
MEQYFANAIAESRREEFAREAATWRLAKLVRRGRTRDPQTEPRPAPHHGEVRRAATA